MKKLCMLLLAAALLLLCMGCDTEQDTTCTTTADVAASTAPEREKPYITSSRETVSVQEEAPALQEKVERYYERRNVRGKAILVIGETRDVPHQRLTEERYIDEYSGEFMNVHNIMEPSPEEMMGFEESCLLPVYTVKEGDALHLYENDVEARDVEIHVLTAQNDTQYEAFDSLSALYGSLEKGRYFCYIDVYFEGDFILHGNGEPCCDAQGDPMRETYCAYACFILELI